MISRGVSRLYFLNLQHLQLSWFSPAAAFIANTSIGCANIPSSRLTDGTRKVLTLLQISMSNEKVQNFQPRVEFN